jgi:hypothetical protein
MKFCPVVPEICRGQVHVPKKERRRKRIIIQHCPISSKFDMWVDNDVPN